MRPTRDHTGRLVLTRRGRLLRSGLALLALLLLAVPLIALARSTGSGAENETGPVPAGDSSSEEPSDPSGSEPAEAAQEQPSEQTPEEPASAEPSDQEPAAQPSAELSERSDGILESGTAGDGTWEVAEPASAEEPRSQTVHTYALRVENGTDIGAAEASEEVADILADARGWQATDEVFFQQVTDPEEADMTISIASPPTTDEMCLPARTGGVWSCRIGPDVVLNSDRWLHMTPTYDDIAEYRAYLVNHEVGHFLGYDHVRCGGTDLAAPVMLQQSIDLQGCRPNAWPALDGEE